MDREKLREVISQLRTLPTWPLIHRRVAAMMENPQTSVRDVAAVINLDPVLTAQLLHTVDWRRSIFAGKVPTVNKAISVMGFEAVRRLVVSQEVLGDTHVSGVGTGQFDLRQLWIHSVATALAAQTLATHAGYADPDECYVAGLLHDIGKLAMLRLYPDRFRSVLADANRARNTFYFCEVDTGFPSHAVFGRLLLEHWALPPKLIEAVGLHHTPNLAETFPKVVGIIHMADIFARALGLGSGGDPYVPPPKPAGLSALGLRLTQIESVMTQIEREFPRAAALLIHA